MFNKNVKNAVCFFENLRNIEELKLSIQKYGLNVVKNHAWNIIIHEDDEDENMNPIHDIPNKSKEMAINLFIILSNYQTHDTECNECT